MAVMSFEHLAPFPRRNHQYHRLYSPSQLERFHVLHILHPIEQTPDSSANKFLPYDFHIFIEKEHLTRRWSIRFSATRPFNRDIKSMPGKLDIRLQANIGMSFSCLCEITCLAPPGPYDKECMDDVARRELEIDMWPPFSHDTILPEG